MRSRGVFRSRNRKKLERIQTILLEAQKLMIEVCTDESDRIDTTTQSFTVNERWHETAIQYLAEGEILDNALKYVKAAINANMGEKTLG